MDSPKLAGMRKWGAGLGLLALMAAGAYLYVTSRGASGPMVYSDPAVALPEEQPLALASAQEAQAAVREQMVAALMQALNPRLEEWLRRSRGAAEAQNQAQRLAVEAWQAELAGHLEAQAQQAENLGRRLDALGHDVRQLRELQMASEPAVLEPTFSLRGLEVWHGQVYALLEHEGRVLPVRQGESRLGWRVRAIDRERRRVRVGYGAAEHVLEMP